MTASRPPAGDSEKDGRQMLRAVIFGVHGVLVDPREKTWREPLHELMESDWSDAATGG